MIIALGNMQKIGPTKTIDPQFELMFIGPGPESLKPREIF